MRSSWKIGGVFCSCLIVVTFAMIWLTAKTLQLDAIREADRIDTELARQEAEIQERTSGALYRMDLKLLPLVTQEIGRPYYAYENRDQDTEDPFLESLLQDDVINRLEAHTLGSIPGLMPTTSLVKAYFQLASNGEFRTPHERTQTGASSDLVDAVLDRSVGDSLGEILEQAQLFCDFDQLIQHFPDPENGRDELAQSVAAEESLKNYNALAIENVKRQISKSEYSDVPKLNNRMEQQRNLGVDRANEDFRRRSQSTNGIAVNNWGNGVLFSNSAIGNQQLQIQQVIQAPEQDLQDRFLPLNQIRQGIMQPIWIEDKLILARRVDRVVDGTSEVWIQCCWLDWDRIQATLQDEVIDLLPDLQFLPILADTQIGSPTALTTLPVQLVIDRSSLLSMLKNKPILTDQPTISLRTSLLIAWLGFGIAVIAAVGMLLGVIRLSERRAVFVSAVTHELRTPLTTFRMYSEMLAEEMVPPAKQKQYAGVLVQQADRLSRLVENVLQFARLERGTRPGIEHITVSIDVLKAMMVDRLAHRAEEAGFELCFEMESSTQGIQVCTQPSMVEQILFNLVDNACKYAKPTSKPQIEINCRVYRQWLQIRVRDYGPGLSSRVKKVLFQPFCQSDQDAADVAGGVGLGLALCLRMATSMGGRLNYLQEANGSIFMLELRILPRHFSV